MSQWLDLVLGDDAEQSGLMQVQQPVQRPAPVARPGSAMPRRQVPAPLSRRDAQDLIFEDDDAPAVQQQAPTPTQLSPQPMQQAAPQGQQRGWLGGMVDTIQGKQDPRYVGIPTIAEVLNNERSSWSAPMEGFGSEQWGWLTGAEDKDMAKVYGGILGDRFIRTEQDSNGYPVLVYRDKQGREAKAYVNAPGLDMQDVGRGIVGAVPFAAAGGAIGSAMQGARLIPRMVGQALGMGATSVAQDAAGVATGTTDLDLVRTRDKAAAAAIGGAGGEAVGAAVGSIWRRLVSEPKYYNRATGQLTPEGQKIVKEAGLDLGAIKPDTLPKLGRAMAERGDVENALRGDISQEFGINTTLGEATRNRSQLLREQQIRGGTYGQTAERGMRQFDALRENAIENAVRGEIEAGRSGIAGQLAPGRAGVNVDKASAGANIRANTQAALQTAKDFERKAWKDVPEFLASSDALEALEPAMQRGLASRRITYIEPGTAAAKMSEKLDAFIAGEMPASGSSFITRGSTGNIDLMRRQLLSTMEDAATPTDKRAAKAIYDTFNDWVSEAAKMTGDPSISSKMLVARGMTRQMREIFDGPQKSAGANILKNILERTDSAEGIVDALFSAPSKSQIKGGAITALQHLKRGYDTYLPKDAAKAAWDDIRLAYWLKTIETRDGKLAGPQALSKAIRGALVSQKSVAQTLYTQEERATMLRLARILDDISRRNPNTSWSAIGIGALGKDLADAFLSMIGGNSIPMRIAIKTVMTPLRDAAGAVRLREATGNMAGAQLPRARSLTLSGPGAAIGAGSERR